MGSAAKWAAQTAWYVDPASGSDDNTGDSSALALKTLSQYHLRTEDMQVLHDTTVTIASSLNSDDVVQSSHRISLDTATLTRYVRYVGVPRLLFTGTISSPVTRSGATSTTGAITCSGLASSWTAGDGVTTFVKKIVQSADGTKSARIEADLGSKVAWITQPLNTTTLLPVTFTNGETVNIYDEVSLGQTVTNRSAWVDYSYCKVSGRWWNQSGELFLRNCSGDAVANSGTLSYTNGYTGIMSGASLFSSGAYALVAGGHHRLVCAAGTMRVSVTPTLASLQSEGTGIITGLSGGSQGTCDFEFNASTLNPFFCTNPDGGRIHCSGYSYGTSGASPVAIRMEGRGSEVSLAHTPVLTGNQTYSFTLAATTGNISAMTSGPVTDVNGNRIVGPGGP